MDVLDPAVHNRSTDSHQSSHASPRADDANPERYQLQWRGTDQRSCASQDEPCSRESTFYREPAGKLAATFRRIGCTTLHSN